MIQTSMKKLIGLLLVVLLCQAEIIEAPDVAINSADLDLSANDEGQFAADHGDDSQDIGLSDQSFKIGPWRGPWGDYGDEYSFDRFYGTFSIVQYYNYRITASPSYFDIDDYYVIFNACYDLRRKYAINALTYAFSWIGGWNSDWNRCNHHDRLIRFAWDQVVRFRYYQNFWRGYNSYNQVVIVAQRVTRPFYRSSRWHTPYNYRRSYYTYPAYDSYRYFDWNNWNSWKSY